MFLNLLNDRQKASFLALATKVVMADGGVVPEENVTLDVRVAELGGDVVAPPDEIYGDPNFKVFSDAQSQAILVMELLVLAYSDAEYHASERPIISELVDAFRLSEEQLKAFEDWAKRQAPLSVEGWDLIRAAEGDWMARQMGLSDGD